MRSIWCIDTTAACTSSRSERAREPSLSQRGLDAIARLRPGRRHAALPLVVHPSTPRDVPPRLAERDGPGAEVDRHVSLGVDDSAGARAPKPPATRHPDPAMTVEGLNPRDVAPVRRRAAGACLAARPGSAVAMRKCCPPGEGCNARLADEPCALFVLRRDGGAEAQRALELWDRYRGATDAKRGRRFLRRSYERARDRALGKWTPWDRPTATRRVSTA